MNILLSIQYCIGKKRKRDTESPSGIITVLSKFMEVSEESERKRRQLEAEIEDKRREQERAHEEKITSMMMSVIQSMWTMQYRLPEISPLSTSTPASSFHTFPNTAFPHSHSLHSTNIDDQDLN